MNLAIFKNLKAIFMELLFEELIRQSSKIVISTIIPTGFTLLIQSFLSAERDMPIISIIINVRRK